ncbi:MAG: hypothetical protein F7C38_06020 [Desulfurococcales archaeon]|nr:hypothetical protein [Desulfurococcales archaeon]
MALGRREFASLVIAVLVLAMYPAVLVHPDGSAGPVVYSGSYDRLSVIIPDPSTRACSVFVMDSVIGELDIIFMVNGNTTCSDIEVYIYNSKIKLIELLGNTEYVDGELQIVNTTNTALTSITISTLTLRSVVVLDSRIGQWLVSARDVSIVDSEFLAVTVTDNDVLLVGGSRGASIYVGQEGGGEIHFENSSLDNGFLPLGTGARLSEALANAPVRVVSPNGSLTVQDSNFTCSSGPCSLEFAGVGSGVFANAILDLAGGVLRWASGGASSSLVLNRTVVRGSVDIRLATSGLGELVVEDSFLGVRGGNATSISGYSVNLSAGRIRVSNSTLTAGRILLSSGSVAIEGSRISFGSLTIDGASEISMIGDRMAGDYILAESRGLDRVSCVGCEVFTTIMLDSIHCNNTVINISNTVFYRGEGLVLRALEGEVAANITGALFMDRRMEFIIYSYPPSNVEAHIVTSKSYYSSLAGPTVKINGETRRYGGAAIDLKGVNATVTIRDWLPGTNSGVVEEAGSTPPFTVEGGHVIPVRGTLPRLDAKEFYIVVLDTPRKEIAIVTNETLRVEAYDGNGNPLANNTGTGRVLLELSYKARELVILYEPIETGIAPGESTASNTSNKGSGALSTVKPGRGSSWLKWLLALLAIAIVILVASLLSRRLH